MDNTIIIGDFPTHVIAYCVGVLNGLGIGYSIDNRSPLYRELKEYRREKYLKMESGIGDMLPIELGYHIEASEDCKVSMTPVWTTR